VFDISIFGYWIALSQISKSGNQYAKTYFQKKISEGKTKVQSLCCLKRRLINIIFMMLWNVPFRLARVFRFDSAALRAAISRDSVQNTALFTLYNLRSHRKNKNFVFLFPLLRLIMSSDFFQQTPRFRKNKMPAFGRGIFSAFVIIRYLCFKFIL